MSETHLSSSSIYRTLLCTQLVLVSIRGQNQVQAGLTSQAASTESRGHCSRTQATEGDNNSAVPDTVPSVNLLPVKVTRHNRRSPSHTVLTARGP